MIFTKTLQKILKEDLTFKPLAKPLNHYLKENAKKLLA